MPHAPAMQLFANLWSPPSDTSPLSEMEISHLTQINTSCPCSRGWSSKRGSFATSSISLFFCKRTDVNLKNKHESFEGRILMKFTKSPKQVANASVSFSGKEEKSSPPVPCRYKQDPIGLSSKTPEQTQN